MPFLACMALAALALAVAAARWGGPARAVSATVPKAAAESVVRGASLPRRAIGLATARRASRLPVRVWCPKPRTLHLTRYEDGSASLVCARRVLARVAVPG